MRCSLTNTLADLTFFPTHPLTLHKNLSFHFGSLSNLVLLAMMIVVPLDCAEIPLLVVFTVFPFTSFLIPPRLRSAKSTFQTKLMLLDFFCVL
jgi:hypothetical protein